MVCGAEQSCGELFLQLLIYGLSNGAVLALNAIGITLVYGSVRVLNLAHGDIFALTSVVVTTLITGLGLRQDWPALLLFAALAGILASEMGIYILLALAMSLLLGVARLLDLGFAASFGLGDRIPFGQSLAGE